MFQPLSEKEEERQLIKRFVAAIHGAKIISLQDDKDDGKTDGLIEYEGKLKPVEARRKGYPNHKGKCREFKDGWNTLFLKDGIFLNELTLRNYIDKSGFIFLVDIKGSPPRACVMNSSDILKLLSQPHKTQRSTNSQNLQSVKCIPLNWFTKEF